MPVSKMPVSRPRMLSGDRPTGRLHLGHYVGSLANRVRLHQSCESFFIIADLHMLTTRNTREDIAAISRNARDMVVDSLAAGLDPAHSVFYLQSAIPEIAEVSVLIQLEDFEEAAGCLSQHVHSVRADRAVGPYFGIDLVLVSGES
jgi:tryptophanyl-tRNA synthetase